MADSGFAAVAAQLAMSKANRRQQSLQQFGQSMSDFGQMMLVIRKRQEEARKEKEEKARQEKVQRQMGEYLNAMDDKGIIKDKALQEDFARGVVEPEVMKAVHETRMGGVKHKFQMEEYDRQIAATTKMNEILDAQRERNKIQSEMRKLHEEEQARKREADEAGRRLKSEGYETEQEVPLDFGPGSEPASITTARGDLPQTMEGAENFISSERAKEQDARLRERDRSIDENQKAEIQLRKDAAKALVESREQNRQLALRRVENEGKRIQDQRAAEMYKSLSGQWSKLVTARLKLTNPITGELLDAPELDAKIEQISEMMDMILGAAPKEPEGGEGDGAGPVLPGIEAIRKYVERQATINEMNRRRGGG